MSTKACRIQHRVETSPLFSVHSIWTHFSLFLAFSHSFTFVTSIRKWQMCARAFAPVLNLHIFVFMIFSLVPASSFLRCLLLTRSLYALLHQFNSHINISNAHAFNWLFYFWWAPTILYVVLFYGVSLSLSLSQACRLFAEHWRQLLLAVHM